MNADLGPTGRGVGKDGDPLEQPVHVYLTVRDPAKAGIPSEVFHLVQVQAARHQAPEGIVAQPTNQSVDLQPGVGCNGR